LAQEHDSHTLDIGYYSSEAQTSINLIVSQANHPSPTHDRHKFTAGGREPRQLACQVGGLALKICFPIAATMVIRTEYRGQRYSMGSSDPFPAGFEIQFRSLNFQAMGNGYLMRITNRAELHPWRSTGMGPIPVTPAVSAPAPAPSSAVGPSAPRRHRRSGQRSRRVRVERRRAARAAAQRDTPFDATTPADGFPHGICNAPTAYTSSAGTDC
jgi:hypothetical protein